MQHGFRRLTNLLQKLEQCPYHTVVQCIAPYREVMSFIHDHTVIILQVGDQGGNVVLLDLLRYDAIGDFSELPYRLVKQNRLVSRLPKLYVTQKSRNLHSIIIMLNNIHRNPI